MHEGHTLRPRQASFKQAYLGLDRFVYRTTLGLLVVLMIIMFLMLIMGVIARYYRQTFIWSQEVAEFSFVWATFLGASAVYRERGHLGLDVLGLMSERLDRWASVVGILLCAAFFVLMVVVGVEYSSGQLDQRSTVLHLPMGAVYAVIPISGALMLLHTGALLLEGRRDLVEEAADVRAF